jgi:hypothetical protein
MRLGKVRTGGGGEGRRPGRRGPSIPLSYTVAKGDGLDNSAVFIRTNLEAGNNHDEMREF